MHRRFYGLLLEIEADIIDCRECVDRTPQLFLCKVDVLGRGHSSFFPLIHFTLLLTDSVVERRAGERSLHRGKRHLAISSEKPSQAALRAAEPHPAHSSPSQENYDEGTFLEVHIKSVGCGLVRELGIIGTLSDEPGLRCR